MGTKRPFDEDLQELFKHPKHLENGIKPDTFGEEKYHIENGNKPDSIGDEKLSLEPSQNAAIVGEGCERVIAVPNIVEKVFETTGALPLVSGISGREEASGPWSVPGPVFCSNLFPELFEFNIPRRPLVQYDDAYSSLLYSSPRKEVPVGPEYQANIPEFDSDSTSKYISNNGIDERLMGICVISHQEGEPEIAQTDCKCLDGGSIRCAQQHVKEARLKLIESIGHEKFFDLGFNNMGEEVACNWTEEEQQHFQDVVYSNPVSHGKKFWEQLSIAFPTRTKKEMVSYYFNVFILRRRAVQNRSQLLAIDSDDDEWWGTKRGSSGVIIKDEDFVVVGPFVDHGDHDSSSEDDDENYDKSGDVVICDKEGPSTSFENRQLKKVASENEQEKPITSNTGLKSESYLHWDPPYSTMGSTKGVDLLPTCSMIEEIFGSSKTGKST